MNISKYQIPQNPFKNKNGSVSYGKINVII
jgi:hypothetical protein